MDLIGNYNSDDEDYDLSLNNDEILETINTNLVHLNNRLNQIKQIPFKNKNTLPDQIHLEPLTIIDILLYFCYLHNIKLIDIMIVFDCNKLSLFYIQE